MCIRDRFTPLGSSRLWAKDIDFGSETGVFGKLPVPQILSSNATANPHFHGFNRVFVPYCSGDMSRRAAG